MSLLGTLLGVLGGQGGLGSKPNGERGTEWRGAEPSGMGPFSEWQRLATATSPSAEMTKDYWIWNFGYLEVLPCQHEIELSTFTTSIQSSHPTAFT